MAQRILIAYDGSAPAERALETAATAFVDPAFTIVTVVDPLDSIGYAEFEAHSIQSLHDERRAQAEERLEEARQHLEAEGFEPDTILRVGDVSREVIDVAEELDVDHLVVGSHGRRGLDRFLLGSVAEKIIRRSPYPVTVVR